MRLLILFITILFFMGNVEAQLKPAQSQYLEEKGALINPSFEQGFKGWTITGCSKSIVSDVPLLNKTLKLTCVNETFSIKQETTLFSPFEGQQLSYRLQIKASAEGVSFAGLENSIRKNTLLVPSSSTYKTTDKIGLIANATSNGIEIFSDTNYTGDIYLDEVSLKLDNLVIDVDLGIGNWTPEQPTTIGATTTNPTKGATIVEDTIRYRRVGDSADINFNFRQNSAGTAGSGNYFIELPDGLEFEYPGSGNSETLGYGMIESSGGVEQPVRFVAVNPNRIYANIVNISGSNLQYSQSFWSSGLRPLSESIIGIYGFLTDVKIKGWSTEKSTITTQTKELTAETANEFEVIISTTGSVTSDTLGLISSCTRTSVGLVNCTYNPTLANSMNLVGSINDGAGTCANGLIRFYNSTNTGFFYNIRDADTGVLIDCFVNIKATKRLTDYNKSQTIVGNFKNINSTPTARVMSKLGAVQSISPGVDINFFNTVLDDTASIIDDANSFTPKVSGYYYIGGYMRLDSIATGTLFIQENGGTYTYKGQNQYLVQSLTAKQDWVFNRMYYLTAGNSYSFEVNITLNINAESNINIFYVPDYEAIVKNLSDQQTLCQTKYLPSNATTNGVVSSLTFNNLEVGKNYRAYMQTRYYVASSLDTIETFIDNGLNRVCYTIASLGTVGEIMFLTCTNEVFTAGATTLTFTINAMNAGNLIQGTNDKIGTSVTLCELPSTVLETTKFN